MFNLFISSAVSATKAVTEVTEAVTGAVTEAASTVGKLDPGAFLSSLAVMGKGMLGIFLVTGVIIGVIYLLSLIKGKEK